MGPPPPNDYITRAKLLGYSIFESTQRPCNLNIVGWRNSYARPNYFDDWLSVYWKGFTKWNHVYWPITTYPGIPWLLKPINPNGAAIMVPGQYLSAYSLGLFKNVLSLKQVKPIKVFRDNDGNGFFDMNPEKIEEGLFGIHIHRAGVWSKLVGTSSAGCQVFQKRADFSSFMKLCTKASGYWGNNFTYTLMEI